MRQLILHRQRALACFGIPYFCVLDQTPQAWTGEIPAGTPLLRNGETIAVDLDSAARTFFIVVPAESRTMVTEAVTIPAGERDAVYRIVTDYDGCRRLGVTLEAVALPEQA